MIEIRAAGVVEAPVARVFDHLADLRTHWELAGGRVRLLDASEADAIRGGRVRMRGPFGLGRDATTKVLRAERPSLLEGRAQIGSATEAEIHWRLERAGQSSTRVELSARVTAAAPLDRVLLAVGGRRWLEALFRRVIARLAGLAPEMAGSPRSLRPALAEAQ